jgi:hypothetical protein
MASENIDDFVISIKLETDKLNQNFSSLSSKFDNFGKDIANRFDKNFNEKKIAHSLDKSKNILNSAMPTFRNILTKGLIGIGSVVGVDFALQFIKGFSSKANNLQLVSGAVGSTPQNAQILQRLYQQTGVNPDSANQVIYQLYKRLHSGVPDVPLAKSLQILGEKFNPNTDPVELILKAYQKIGSFKGENKEVLRNQLLGGMGLENEASTYLVNNPDKASKYLEEAKKNNLSDNIIDKYADMERRFQAIGQRWKNIEGAIMNGILPGIELFTKGVETLLNLDMSPLSREISVPGVNKMINSKLQGVNKMIGLNQSPINLNSSLNDLWKFVTGVESSGGKNKERDNRANNPNDYSFGSGHITLNTAKKYMSNVTPEMLRANNYQLADELAKKELANNLNQSKGNVLEALSRYHTGKPNSSTNEMQRYISSGYKYQKDIQQSTRQNHGAINHNKQVAYNVNGITMHGVQDVKGFTDELQRYALDTTAFNVGSNIIA